MDKNEINIKVKEIVEKRLIAVDAEIKNKLPKILRNNEVNWFILSTLSYVAIIFFSNDEKPRIDELIKKGYHPFPGLIAEIESVPVAFKFEKSRNVFLSNNSVNNAFCLSIGKDSTIIICNHSQEINTAELGPYKYEIDLAYIISYGDEISEFNLIDFIDGLIAHSVEVWRSQDHE